MKSHNNSNGEWLGNEVFRPPDREGPEVVRNAVLDPNQRPLEWTYSMHESSDRSVEALYEKASVQFSSESENWADILLDTLVSDFEKLATRPEIACGFGRYVSNCRYVTLICDDSIKAEVENAAESMFNAPKFKEEDRLLVFVLEQPAPHSVIREERDLGLLVERRLCALIVTHPSKESFDVIAILEIEEMPRIHKFADLLDARCAMSPENVQGEYEFFLSGGAATVK